MRKLLAFLLAITSTCVGANEALEEFKKEYEAGVALLDKPGYKEVYESTSSRIIDFVVVKESEEKINALYTIHMIKNGAEEVHRGGVVFQIKDGRVVSEDHLRMAGDGSFDMTRSGQGADILTTAVSLANGGIEANPLMAGVISSPAGAVLMSGIKLGLVDISDHYSASYRDCVQNRNMIGGVGWAAAGWNMGVIVAANPFVAIIGGILGAVGTHEMVKDSAIVACLEEM